MCTIFIEKHEDELVIYNNEFKGNMGLFGGAISLNNMVYSIDVVQDESFTTPSLYEKPKLVVNNRFENNYAYQAGGAVYINQYRR